MSATPKPYAPPTLTLLTGQTTDEVLAASHALVTLVEERKARSGLSGEFSPRYVDRELCDAVLGYVKLVCNLLDSLPAAPVAGERFAIAKWLETTDPHLPNREIADLIANGVHLHVHPDTDRPPADPTLTTCTKCKGTGYVEGDSLAGMFICPDCFGVGAT